MSIRARIYTYTVYPISLRIIYCYSREKDRLTLVYICDLYHACLRRVGLLDLYDCLRTVASTGIPIQNHGYVACCRHFSIHWHIRINSIVVKEPARLQCSRRRTTVAYQMKQAPPTHYSKHLFCFLQYIRTIYGTSVHNSVPNLHSCTCASCHGQGSISGANKIDGIEMKCTVHQGHS
jgi:hypothetical protein